MNVVIINFNIYKMVTVPHLSIFYKKIIKHLSVYYYGFLLFYVKKSIYEFRLKYKKPVIKEIFFFFK